MAIAGGLNTYSYNQLNPYSYDTLQGTVYFHISADVTWSRDIIGDAASCDTCGVTWVCTASVDGWECRATLDGEPAPGMGLLLGSGGAVTANTSVSFNVTNAQLTMGDGKYRITVYVQLIGIWYGGE